MTIRTVVLLLISVNVLLIQSTASGRDVETKKNPHALWEKAIAAFENADQNDRRPRDGILFVGSSSIRLWDLEHSFPDLSTINHGFGGSEIADTIHFADRIVWPFSPRVIVLYAGDNDIAGGQSAQDTTEDFKTFSKQVNERLPNTRLIFIAIKPSIRRWALADEIKRANGAIADICDQDDKRVFLDIWTPMLGDDGRPRPDLFVKDGLHLNEAGYQLWTELLSAELPERTEETLRVPADD